MRKGRVENALPKQAEEFDIGDNRQYKVKAIVNSAMYSQQTNNQILSLYYLVLWKGYLEEKNT